MSSLSGLVLLDRSHDYADFDCGRQAVNTFLVRHALANQANGSARTYVGLDGNRVVGYYSLAAGALLCKKAPARMAKGLARHPIPILLMARFAVDLSYQGQGIGSRLFKDALKRWLGVGREVGSPSVHDPCQRRGSQEPLPPLWDDGMPAHPTTPVSADHGCGAKLGRGMIRGSSLLN